MGQCPGCKAWNTFVEEAVSTKKNVVFRQPDYGAGAETGAVKLKDIRISEDERRLTKIGELDRVLGGGIVPGSSCSGGWRSGNRKVHPSFAGMQKSVSVRKLSALYFRGGVFASDPSQSQPDRRI